MLSGIQNERKLTVCVTRKLNWGIRQLRPSYFRRSKLDIRTKSCARKDSVISEDVRRYYKKPPARAHNPGRGGYSSFRERTQITNGQIHSGHFLLRRQQRDYGEGHRRVDQRSNGTAMDNT